MKLLKVGYFSLKIVRTVFYILLNSSQIKKKVVLFFLDPPQPHHTFERFGYVIGRQGIINVTIYAHPRPRFTWRVNDEKIDEGRPDESNRLETSTAVDLVSFLLIKLNFIGFPLYDICLELIIFQIFVHRLADETSQLEIEISFYYSLVFNI